MPTEPHDAPDPMTRDFCWACTIMGLVLAGVAVVSWGVYRFGAWVATW
jgi:hypothetical protein